MRAVKAAGTGPEIRLRRALHALGFRYRLHAPDLPGRPDLVFRTRRAAVFVHGCFWHGHACRRGARKPAANAEYWAAKIARNQARDGRVACELEREGWRVAVVWECALATAALRTRTVTALAAWLDDGKSRLECPAATPQPERSGDLSPPR